MGVSLWERPIVRVCSLAWKNRFHLLARFARVKFLKFCVEKFNWNVFENLCQFGGLQVIFSERTPWPRSRLRCAPRGPDRHLPRHPYKRLKLLLMFQRPTVKPCRSKLDYGKPRGPNRNSEPQIDIVTTANHVALIDGGLPSKGWSFRLTKVSQWSQSTDRFEFSNLFPDRIKQFRGQTLQHFWPIFAIFPGRTLKTFSRSNFASICRSFFLLCAA